MSTETGGYSTDTEAISGAEDGHATPAPLVLGGDAALGFCHTLAGGRDRLSC